MSSVTRTRRFVGVRVYMCLDAGVCASRLDYIMHNACTQVARNHANLVRTRHPRRDVYAPTCSRRDTRMIARRDHMCIHC